MLSNFAFLGLVGDAVFIFFAVVIAILLFEVVMFINVIRNKSITDTVKILWVIGMLLIHPFVAIGYYFTDYKKS